LTIFEHPAPNKRALQISSRILLVWSLFFVLFLVISTLYLFTSQHALLRQIAAGNVSNMAEGYVADLGTMRVSGKIENHEFARHKILAIDGVVAARILRGTFINKSSRSGNSTNTARDKLDLQALQGKQIRQFTNGPDGEILTLIQPLRASTDSHGINCINCHKAPEGEILGAIRIDYSLSAVNTLLRHNIWQSLAINVVLLVISLLILSWILRKFVVRPLRVITTTINRYEAESHSGGHLNLSQGNELGKLGLAIDNLLGKFSYLLEQLRTTAHQLVDTSEQMKLETTQHICAAKTQQLETDKTASDMLAFHQTTASIAEHAVKTADSSGQNNKLADSGQDQVSNTEQQIRRLAAEISAASIAIEKIEQENKSIGEIVSVIANIAEQINLLTLNAAIEAARAGEHGRGFAIVANEIHALANRTQESTKKIQTITLGFQQQSTTAAQAMDRSNQCAKASIGSAELAAQLLKQITQAISQTSEMSQLVATATQQQVAVSAQLHDDVQHIKQATDQTVAQAQVTAKSGDQLAALLNQLQQLIKEFKT